MNHFNGFGKDRKNSNAVVMPDGVSTPLAASITIRSESAPDLTPILNVTTKVLRIRAPQAGRWSDILQPGKTNRQAPYHGKEPA
jgi:hypothetical protein